jgi:hypothetical protein
VRGHFHVLPRTDGRIGITAEAISDNERGTKKSRPQLVWLEVVERMNLQELLLLEGVPMLDLYDILRARICWLWSMSNDYRTCIFFLRALAGRNAMVSRMCCLTAPISTFLRWNMPAAKAAWTPVCVKTLVNCSATVKRSCGSGAGILEAVSVEASAAGMAVVAEE